MLVFEYELFIYFGYLFIFIMILSDRQIRDYRLQDIFIILLDIDNLTKLPSIILHTDDNTFPLIFLYFKMAIDNNPFNFPKINTADPDNRCACNYSQYLIYSPLLLLLRLLIV